MFLLLGLGRKSVLLVLLAAASAIPYLALEKGWRQSVKARLSSLVSEDATAALPPATGLGQVQLGTREAGASADQSASPKSAKSETAHDAASLEGAPVEELAEVLRFDVSPQWITSRWSRVTTALGEAELVGLRVPLVTGTGLDDLAGCLTYYFDPQQQVQRISFHGYTGDSRRVIVIAEQLFGLRREPSLSAGLYLSRWNGKPKSALRISHAPVVRASSPHANLEVMLEVNRPNNYYRLSQSFAQLLASEQPRRQRRW